MVSTTNMQLRLLARYNNSPTQRCGTFKLASSRFRMLNSPSPRIKPLAKTMMGVSLLPFHRRHQRLMRPPTVRASVKEGVLYMPTPMLADAHYTLHIVHTNSDRNTPWHKVNPPPTQAPLFPVRPPDSDYRTYGKNHCRPTRPLPNHRG
jgi:hypothetical protein